ncbi:MAG TPA: hypothetical protein VGI39_19645 [Polyangiaceae bacterium]|jgi:hypothetical protein
MNDLSDETLDFLREAKGAHDAPAGAKERVRAAVSLAVAAPLAGGMAAARGASRWTGASKTVVMIAAVAGVGAALLVGRSATTHHAQRQASARAEVAHVSAPPAETLSETTPQRPSSARPLPPPPAETSRAVPRPASSSDTDGLTPIDPSTLPRVAASPSRSGSAASKHTAPSADGSVAAEFALLRRVSAALQSGDHRAALAGVREHAHRFPHGVLAEERDTDRILALCALGRRDEATRALTRFDRDYPDSAHGARVHAACATSPDEDAAEEP